MGKFLAPRATTAQRIGITPDEGELIYDTELNMFFSGDGATGGGVVVTPNFVTYEGEIVISEGEQVFT